MKSGLFKDNPAANQADVEIDETIISLMNKHNVNAIGYALIDNFKISRVKTTGQDEELKTQSLFQACSLSKSIAAYGVLDLVAQHKIELDTPINTYLTSWKLTNSVH